MDKDHVVWHNKPIILERGKIQKVQNRALRICGLAGRYTSNLTLHRHFKVLPIMLRCKLDILVAMHKRLTREPTPGTSEGVSTWAQSVPTIPVPRARSARFMNSIAYQGPLIWESIPPYMKGIRDLESFKKCARLLVMQDFESLTCV